LKTRLDGPTNTVDSRLADLAFRLDDFRPALAVGIGVSFLVAHVVDETRVNTNIVTVAPFGLALEWITNEAGTSKDFGSFSSRVANVVNETTSGLNGWMIIACFDTGREDGREGASRTTTTFPSQSCGGRESINESIIRL